MTISVIFTPGANGRWINFRFCSTSMLRVWRCERKRNSFLEKAESAIGAAESLLRDGYRDFAAGRAYYAMFYTAEALLAEKELVFKKARWGCTKLFRALHPDNQAVFEQKYYHWLVAAFNSRTVGDYAIRTEFEDDEVRVGSIRRGGFLEKVREYPGKSVEYQYVQIVN
ncbi:MAG: HEPN domain-containing protein [Anaerolineales bacterium]